MRGHGAHDEMQVACRNPLLISLLHFRQSLFLDLVLALVVEVGPLYLPVVDLVSMGVFGAGAACRVCARELVGEAVLTIFPAKLDLFLICQENNSYLNPLNC